jgi:hypothetical protein
MTVIVHPLTPERWDDLESIFNANGCSIAHGCWCGKTLPNSPSRRS